MITMTPRSTLPHDLRRKTDRPMNAMSVFSTIEIRDRDRARNSTHPDRRSPLHLRGFALGRARTFWKRSLARNQSPTETHTCLAPLATCILQAEPEETEPWIVPLIHRIRNGWRDPRTWFGWYSCHANVAIAIPREPQISITRLKLCVLH